MEVMAAFMIHHCVPPLAASVRWVIFSLDMEVEEAVVAVEVVAMVAVA
jgi:hypothetical protein